MSKFPLGTVVMTQGVAEVFGAEDVPGCPDEVAWLIARHMNGDWGDMCDEDKAQNEDALVNGGRLFSSYTLEGDGTKVWVITEWDRSVTTVLLPDEY